MSSLEQRPTTSYRVPYLRAVKLRIDVSEVIVHACQRRSTQRWPRPTDLMRTARPLCELQDVSQVLGRLSVEVSARRVFIFVGVWEAISSRDQDACAPDSRVQVRRLVRRRRTQHVSIVSLGGIEIA